MQQLTTTKPGDKYRSLKWPALYEKLRARGYSKAQAARISNAQARKRHKALDVLEHVATKGYSQAIIDSVADLVPELPRLKGEQIAPGVTRIRGNLCNVHGKYGPCDGGKGGGKKPKAPKGRKPRAAAKPKKTPEQRQQERETQHAQNRADVLGKMNIAPDGQQALDALRKGEQPDASAVTRHGFEQAGLVERGRDGQYRLTASGRAMLSAADAGDAGRAGATIGSARDRVSARQDRQSAAEQRKQQAQAKREQAQKLRAARLAKRGGGKGSSASGSGDTEAAEQRRVRFEQGQQDREARLQRQAQRDQEHEQDRADRQRRQSEADARRQRAEARGAARAESARYGTGNNRANMRRHKEAIMDELIYEAVLARLKEQTDQEKAMFAKMGGGGSGGGGGKGGGGSTLWKKGPDGKRTPQAGFEKGGGGGSSGGGKAPPKGDGKPTDRGPAAHPDRDMAVKLRDKRDETQQRLRKESDPKEKQRLFDRYRELDDAVQDHRRRGALSEHEAAPLRDSEIRRGVERKKPTDNLPQDLRDMTPGQHRATVDQLSKLPLSELRRRQDLVRQQQKIAYEEHQRSGFSERNDRGAANLDIMEQHLRAAIDKQVFGSDKKKPKKTKAVPSSFQVFKDARGQWRWVGISSTAYRDKDGEIVSTKALQDDCARADRDGSYGVLDWWHTPLVLGDCDFNAMHGRVLIESGTFKSERIARLIAPHAPELEMSLAFLHPPTEPDTGKVFHSIHRFARSLTPRGKASNLFTSFHVKESPVMDETKKAALKQLGFSDADITDLETRAAQTQKSADAQGVAFKAEEPEPPNEIVIGGVTYTVKQIATIADAGVAGAESGAALKAALPMEEEQPAVVEEDAMPPDGEMDDGMDDSGGLSLSQEDIDAIGQAVGAALTQALQPLMGLLDIEKKMAAHVQGVMGQYQATKEAKDAETTQRVEQLAETVKQQGDTLAELVGDQPEVRLGRPSESASTVINPFIPADQQLLEAAKAQQQQPAFEFQDLVGNLFGNANTTGQP